MATIKKINIIGARRVAVKKLKDEMQLRDRRGLPFSTRSQYSKQKLEADVESIRSYYLNRGYHDFEIISTNVDISPNKQNVFVSISLFEGEQYVFGETRVEGGEETAVVDLQEQITISDGEPFSRKLVSESRAAIADRFADAVMHSLRSIRFSTPMRRPRSYRRRFRSYRISACMCAG